MHEVNDRQALEGEVLLYRVILEWVNVRESRIRAFGAPQLDLCPFAGEGLKHPHNVGRHGLLGRKPPMRNADYFHSFPTITRSSPKGYIARLMTGEEYVEQRSDVYRLE